MNEELDDDPPAARVAQLHGLLPRGLRAFGDVRCFPEWETLRAEPRVREILRRIGLSS